MGDQTALFGVGTVIAASAIYPVNVYHCNYRKMLNYMVACSLVLVS